MINSFSRYTVAILLYFAVNNSFSQSGTFDDSVAIYGSTASLTLANLNTLTGWSLYGNSDGTGEFTIEDCDIAGCVASFYVEDGAPENSIFIGSAGKVGIGTNTPGGGPLYSNLTIAPSTETLTPSIHFDNPFGNSFVIGASTFIATGGFFIANQATESIPFYVYDVAEESTLVLGPEHTVGIGVDEPESSLHILSTTGTQLLVENTDNTVTAAQEMFELKNASPGKIRFAITNNSNNTWTFDNNYYSDWFSISKVGTGLDEFVVKSNGDGVFRGRSYAISHVNTSSRSVKTGFAEIDARDILDRLAKLSVTEWRYIGEADAQRHVGPVAEDFKKVFDLGDGKTISTVDASGIAFAAIKGLKDQKDAEILELKSELARQRELIEMQSRQMQQMKTMLSAFESKSAQTELGTIKKLGKAEQ